METNKQVVDLEYPLYVWYDKTSKATRCLSRSATPDDLSLGVVEVTGELKTTLMRSPNDLIYVVVSVLDDGEHTLRVERPVTLNLPVFKEVQVCPSNEGLDPKANVVIAVYAKTSMIDVSAGHAMPDVISLSICDTSGGPFTPLMMVRAPVDAVNSIDARAVELLKKEGIKIYFIDCDSSWHPVIILYE